MAGSTIVKVEGFKDLDKAMSELTRATAKNVAKRALLTAGQPIADAAQKRVPVLSGNLKKSIVVGTRTGTKPGSAEFARAMREGKSRQEAGAAMRAASGKGDRAQVIVLIGSGQLPHAHLVEFGSVNNAPHPYLRPAWDEGKQQVLDDIKAALADEIGKAAARAAKRALKAKG